MLYLDTAEKPQAQTIVHTLWGPSWVSRNYKPGNKYTALLHE